MKRIALVLLSVLVAQTAHAHGISATDQQSMIAGGYVDYIKLGATHMLTGYDHLLFLFGVIFFMNKFKDITKFITAFTIGHSLTLIFATFMGISANYFLIDAAIALTVVYKGFDNLGGFQKLFKVDSPNLLTLVFIFGLVHGFGLSTRLQQLPLGEDGLLLRILSFNLGVEVGQILALTVMLVLLKAWRQRESFARFSTVSNAGLVVAGFLLFFFQMSGYAGSFSEEATASEFHWQDTVSITIPANGALEYKFHIQENDRLDYSWQTDGGPLYFDFHGDPAGDTTGYFKTFEEATKSESAGFLLPPFEGNIGWYWKNKSDAPVVVDLKTSGDYEIKGIQ